ncbi:uncharacterized protein LOC106055137 [Biomphalaria glabrata]|uniref:Uncharacterized protein LOC106055137 n=1 Tax=Biomphalaria glabrata TaxID=6526 RepID=A0A9W2YSB2_BIOGL|nr:uncharacterized protein LOC106055137 [Biomphalaria glabrata]
MCEETGMDVSYVIFFLRHLFIVTGSPWLPSINITHKPATVSGCDDGLVAGVDRLNLHVSVHSAAQADWHVGRHFGLVRHSHQNGSEELVCFFAYLSATQCKGIKQIQEVHSCNCSDHLSTQSILIFTAELSVQMSDQKNGYVFFWNATNTSEPTESSDTYSSTMWTLPVQIVDNVTYCRSDHRRIVRRVEDLKRLPPNLIIQPPPILILQPYETIHPSERRCKFGLLDKEGELFVRVFVNASNSWRINKTLGFVRSNIYYDFNLTAMDELCTMKFKTVTNARYEWNPSDCCTCSVRNAMGGMMVSMAMTVNMYYQLWPVTFFWASSDGGKVERMYSPKYYIEETIYRNKEECEREGNNLTAGVDKEKIRKIRIRQYQSPENLCDYGIVEFKDIITLRAYVNIGAYTSWLVEKQFGFQRHWQYIPTRIDCLIKFTSKETYESNSPGMYSCEAFIIYNEGHVVFIFRTTVPRLFWYIPYSFFYNLPVLGAQGIYKKIETKKFFIKDDIYKSLNECMSTTVKRTKQRPLGCLEKSVSK